MRSHSTTTTGLDANSKSSSRDARIFRSPHDRENPYVMVSKELINDRDISLECMAFLIFLLSKPADWNIHVSQLTSEFSGRIGEKKIYSLIREAIEAGYMKRVDILERGLKNGCNYFVSEEPIYREDFQKFQRCGKKRHAVNCRANILSNDIATNIQRHKEAAPQGDPPSPKIEKKQDKPPAKQTKLADGTIQLAQQFFKGVIPSENNAKMTQEVKQLLGSAFMLGRDRVRIHPEDWSRFYGFSPATISAAADRIHKRSKDGMKIRSYTSMLLAECGKVASEKSGSRR